MATPKRYMDASGRRYKATRFDWLQPVCGETGEKICTRFRERSASFASKPVAVVKEPAITSQTRLFTMGSCFAQEIRRHLLKKCFNVHQIGNSKLDASLIWYNAFSILDEFKRLTGEFTQDIDDVWNTERGFQDPYRRQVFAPTRDELWKRINYINSEIKSGLLEAEVIIITLGMTEVWFRNLTAHAVCAAPGYLGGGGDLENERFRATDYERNCAALTGIVERLRKINPNAKLIFTVSPVPLGVTFRSMDHAIANMESKSILRAAVGAICESPGGPVDGPSYFHSYEIASLSQTTKERFKRDGRHIQPEMIETIMHEFERHYVVEEDRTCPDATTTKNTG